jgi:GNAT superfamily N-acetyltransferase
MNAADVELMGVDSVELREAARSLITEYLEWIGEGARERYGLSFDLGAMVASDLAESSGFWPPSGRFYLVRHAGSFVGVGCLKSLSATAAEIQRMYIKPHVRGIGAGRRLLERLLADARAIGYRVIRLESLKFLTAAHSLYKSAGFVEIAPYADNSMRHYQPGEALEDYRASAVFLELRFDTATEPSRPSESGDTATCSGV